MVQSSWQIAGQSSQGIGQKRPAAAHQPSANGLLINGEILRQTTPWASNDDTGPRWIQSGDIAMGLGRRRPEGEKQCFVVGQDGIQQWLMLCQRCMDRFLHGKVEMHGARCRLIYRLIRPVGLDPCQSRKLKHGRGGHGMQPLRGTIAKPTTGGTQKVLLIHRLIGATRLESDRTISGDNEQRLTGPISFNHRGQQIGDRRSRGGHHSHAGATSGSQPQCQKRCRPFINGSVELKLPRRRQQTSCCR